jgi:uncharacterized protein YqhQ
MSQYRARASIRFHHSTSCVIGCSRINFSCALSRRDKKKKKKKKMKKEEKKQEKNEKKNAATLAH